MRRNLDPNRLESTVTELVVAGQHSIELGEPVVCT